MSERKLIRGGLEDIAPNNSDRAVRARENIEPNLRPEERKKLKPVVKGPVIQKKPSFLEKFKSSFLGDSTNIGEYIMYDILVPAFRNTMSDLGFGIVDMLFGGGRGYGRNYDSSRVVRDRGRSYVSYNTISDRESRGRYRDVDRTERARHDFNNIVYDTREEAEEVLSHLVDRILEYREATVAEFCELSNIEPRYTDDRYGWTNLRDAYTERARNGYNGYIIRFPPVRPL